LPETLNDEMLYVVGGVSKADFPPKKLIVRFPDEAAGTVGAV
jgi:hypothetical protein